MMLYNKKESYVPKELHFKNSHIYTLLFLRPLFFKKYTVAFHFSSFFPYLILSKATVNKKKLILKNERQIIYGACFNP